MKNCITKLLIANDDNQKLTITDSCFDDFPKILKAGDLLVVNNAATLPGSFFGIHTRTQKPIEMRLMSLISDDLKHPLRWSVFLFGDGDWRTPTEHRNPPPLLQMSDELEFQSNLRAKIILVHSSSPRLVDIEFQVHADSPLVSLWHQLYHVGNPIQYSHLSQNLNLWDVQTLFADIPVALEAPSAAFPLNWELVLSLKKTGVQISSITHAAGVSSTGDPQLDALLPVPERYWISEETADAVNTAHAEGRRVIALGTSVTRALESAVILSKDKEFRKIKSGSGLATLLIAPEYERKIVTGIISGFHEKGASHLKLLGSFIAPRKLEALYQHADAEGYRYHEFGDICFLAMTTNSLNKKNFPIERKNGKEYCFST